jgi:hypothetical protein
VVIRASNRSAVLVPYWTLSDYFYLGSAHINIGMLAAVTLLTVSF